MKTSNKIIIGVLAVFFLAAVITPKFMFIEDSVSKKISMKMTGKTMTVKVKPFAKLILFENYLEADDKSYDVIDNNGKPLEVVVEECDSIETAEVVFDAAWDGNLRIKEGDDGGLNIDFTMEKLLESYPAGGYDCVVAPQDKVVVRIRVPHGTLHDIKAPWGLTRLLHFKDATISFFGYCNSFIAEDCSFNQLYNFPNENDASDVVGVDADETEEAQPVQK